MFPKLDLVTASYHRCRERDDFIDTFYNQFLATSREVADKFRGTDFKRQKLMLRESLLSMLLYNLGYEDAQEELEQLAERHSRREVDIAPNLYDLWLDSLVETISICDLEYTEELGQLWRAAMQPGIDLLISKY
ncbi:MAG: globin [Planctomycetales bacterium]|nr:globin [Planctomycetales bacterium]